MSLLRGSAGERGKTGDHGQIGDTGPAGPTGGVRVTWPQTLAFVLIVALGAGGFYETQRLADERVEERRAQTAELCQRAAENRDALRDGLAGIGDEVAELGRSLIVENPGVPPTAEEQQALRSVERFEARIATQVETLPPIDCPEAQPAD